MDLVSKRMMLNPLMSMPENASPTDFIGFTELAAKIGDEMWKTIYGKSSRKVRNMLEGMFIKKKAKRQGGKVSLKSRERDTAALKVRQGMINEANDQFCEEVFKNWFFTHPEILADSLDFFGIAHENGITEEELDPITEADETKIGEYLSHMKEKKHELDVIAIYLAFVQCPAVAKVPELKSVFDKWSKETTATQPEEDPFMRAPKPKEEEAQEEEPAEPEAKAEDKG